MKLAYRIALLTLCSIAAFAQNASSHALPSAWCLDLNEAAIAQAARGYLAEAEALLPTTGDERSQGVCSGLVLSHIAKTTFVLGRLAEAERLAERSVRILEQFYPPNDWVLLRPLQNLANVQLESGKTARAREIVKRIQSIRINGPEDRAIVHSTLGTLRQIEGRKSEAEAEYQEAFRAWEEAGRSESANAAVVLDCLGSLYLEEQRLDDAQRVLDRALAIYSLAKDAVAIDRINIFALRGILHARLGEWRRSEQDLGDALSTIDRQPSVDPTLLRSLLGNYSYVLRRNHHLREARSIEARTAALPTNRTAAAVVDITELRVGNRAAKK
jgi:tetratricopeptide (TPR) repeat protein